MPESVQTLIENPWLSLKIVRKPEAGVNGYVFSHETRCQGRIVAVLPYRETARGREYLTKREMTPCWGFAQVRSAMTGGYEGGDIEDDAVREMLEETGYAITRRELIDLGESYASKSADTVYTLFSVDLTGREPGEALGDGTRLESESAAEWVTAAELASVLDPQVHVMFVRLGALGVPAAPPPPPSGRLARIEVKGFRDLGVVRVTEATFAGEPMVHAERTPWSSEAFEGDAADFPASSLHFVTWLPERLIAEGTHRAISGRDYIGPPDIDDRDDYPDRSY